MVDLVYPAISGDSARLLHEEILRLRADLAAAQAKVKEVSADAERYQIWRKVWAEGPQNAPLLVEIAFTEGEEEIDAAIDAARAKPQSET